MKDNNQMAKESSKKKHSRIKKAVVILWCVLFLCIGIGIGFAIHNTGKETQPTEKVVLVSPSPECTAKACVWLSGVDEAYWNYNKVSALFSDMTVEVQGTYNADTKTWQWTVSDQSYSDCETMAYERLGLFFKNIIITEGNLEPDIDENLTDLLGMPLSEYLKTCDIDLMPSKGELLGKVTLTEKGGVTDEK